MAKFNQDVVGEIMQDFLKEEKGKINESKNVYIIYDYASEYSLAIKITEEQKRAMEWMSRTFDLNINISSPEDCAEEI